MLIPARTLPSLWSKVHFSNSLGDSFPHLKSCLHKLHEDVVTVQQRNSETVREAIKMSHKSNVSNTRESGTEVTYLE